MVRGGVSEACEASRSQDSSITLHLRLYDRPLSTVVKAPKVAVRERGDVST